MTITLTMPNINNQNKEDKYERKSLKTSKTSGLLLDILVCPNTKSLLIYDNKAKELLSIQGKKAYPIEENCPILSEYFSRDLSSDEINKWQEINSRRRKK